LVALILRKGYDAITIQDIIDEANVGRSTFYSHFTGKDDLFRKGFVHLREMLHEQHVKAVKSGLISDSDALGFSLPMFQHVKSHRELYVALVGGRGGAIAIHEVRALLADMAKRDLDNLFGDRPPAKSERELVLQFVVGAFMSILTWWLDRNSWLLSYPAVAIRLPSGENATSRTVSVCSSPRANGITAIAPGSGRRCEVAVPRTAAFRSQILMVWSVEPVAIHFPSGEISSDQTSSVWPVRRAT
jgi:AcrR family transcriptional regulator